MNACFEIEFYIERLYFEDICNCPNQKIRQVFKAFFAQLKKEREDKSKTDRCINILFILNSETKYKDYFKKFKNFAQECEDIGPKFWDKTKLNKKT